MPAIAWFRQIGNHPFGKAIKGARFGIGLSSVIVFMSYLMSTYSRTPIWSFVWVKLVLFIMCRMLIQVSSFRSLVFACCNIHIKSYLRYISMINVTFPWQAVDPSEQPGWLSWGLTSTDTIWSDGSLCLVSSSIAYTTFIYINFKFERLAKSNLGFFLMKNKRYSPKRRTQPKCKTILPHKITNNQWLPIRTEVRGSYVIVIKHYTTINS